MLKLKSLKGNFGRSNKLIKKLLSIILIIAVQAISISGLQMSEFMQIEVKAAQSIADTNANTKTKNILDNLSVLKDKSDAKVVSGQDVCDGNGMSLSDAWNPAYPVSEAYDMQITDLYTTTGKWVGLQGYDMWRHDESIIDGQLVNPLTDPVQAIDSSSWRDYAKSHSDNGGLVTMICHFRNPWGRDSLGRGKAWSDIPAGNNLGDLIDPSKPVYNTWISLLDKIASELQWFEDNDVTVLWRPLPECNGDWFWWCQGSDTDYKNVWQHMFNYLTNTKGLHNLIWVYSPADNSPPATAKNRYPGSNYVDIIGFDCYRDSLGKINLYDTFLNYGKVLALCEFGGPANYASVISDIKKYNPNIAYYMAWAGEYSILLNNNQSGLLGDSWSVNRGDIDFSVSAPTTAPTEAPTATPGPTSTPIAPTPTPVVSTATPAAPTATPIITPVPTMTATEEPTQTESVTSTPAPVSFTDIDNYGWAQNSIINMAQQGIIVGVGDNKFAPQDNLTRAEFATMIDRLMGYQNETADSDFSDVQKDSWYYIYVSIAYSHGIIKGTSDTTFDPDANITRQDMAVIIARTLNLTCSDIDVQLAKFSDKALIADYAKEAIAGCVQIDVIHGNDDGTFSPVGNATRAEAAVLMNNVYNYIHK